MFRHSYMSLNSPYESLTRFLLLELTQGFWFRILFDLPRSSTVLRIYKTLKNVHRKLWWEVCSGAVRGCILLCVWEWVGSLEVVCEVGLYNNLTCIYSTKIYSTDSTTPGCYPALVTPPVPSSNLWIAPYLVRAGYFEATSFFSRVIQGQVMCKVFNNSICIIKKIWESVQSFWISHINLMMWELQLWNKI